MISSADPGPVIARSELARRRFSRMCTKERKEIDAIGDRLVAIIEDYIEHFHDLSNDKALELTEGYLAAEGDRLQVRRSYLPEFAKAQPGRTVARSYQIENKMDAVIRYELAVSIPVVGEESK